MNRTIFILFHLFLVLRDGFGEDASRGDFTYERRRFNEHRTRVRRRWNPRNHQSRHPLRDIFFPAEAVFSSATVDAAAETGAFSRLRSHEKRDAVDSGSTASETGDAHSGASVKSAAVFFNPAGTGVALDAKGKYLVVVVVDSILLLLRFWWKVNRQFGTKFVNFIVPLFPKL